MAILFGLRPFCYGARPVVLVVVLVRLVVVVALFKPSSCAAADNEAPAADRLKWCWPQDMLDLLCLLFPSQPNGLTAQRVNWPVLQNVLIHGQSINGPAIMTHQCPRKNVGVLDSESPPLMGSLISLVVSVE